MLIGISIYPGTGRAHCAICQKKIEKGEKQVNIVIWREQRNVHQACLMKRLKEGNR